jgi:cell wall-associated NlpC family hydrolase
MKKQILLCLALVIFTANARAEEKLPPLPKGPMILTSATRAMQSPDYWINKIPNAEKAVKTPAEVEKFNDFIRSFVKENVDVFKLDTVRPGKQITDILTLEYETLKNRKLFGVDDKYVPKSFFEEQIKPLVQIDKVPSRVKMKWGAVVRSTSVRAIPTMVKMLEEKGDVEFDQLQFTLVKLWTPVGIYHSSSDGKWLYIQAPYVRGWVKAKDIAIFPNRGELKKYAGSDHFLVVTGESVKVYKDSQRTILLQKPSMGTVIPLAAAEKSQGTKTSSGSGNYVVWMLYRKEGGGAGVAKAYINKSSDVSKKFPAYSQANIIRQAFKLLGQRYGWGGQYNGRDCSGFVHDVFLSMGVAFPRDSKQQAIVGTQLGFFKPNEDDAGKKAALNSARPGLALIKMPHHQMMYLGKVNGEHYVIHSTWAERTGGDPKKDAKNRINQVVVSDLELNGRSYVGSLFDRIVSINEID